MNRTSERIGDALLAIAIGLAMAVVLGVWL
jgi:hypothetical protein